MLKERNPVARTSTDTIAVKSIKAVEEMRRVGDPAVLISSSEKVRKILDWNLEHEDLEEIIATAWKWHSNHPNGYDKV